MLIVSVSLYTPIVALLTVAYAKVSPWTLPLFFLPALAAQRLFGLYQEQRKLTEQLVVANTDLEKANLSFATALVTTLDARDRYTAGHSAAVAIYARDIAVRMGLPEAVAGVAHLAGLVHDIGKIGLSAGVLEKPGALTLEERREMQRHSEIGERILAKVDTYTEIASIVRHHHERVDGGRYPDGVVGDKIPMLSRIIAVADAYNAMTSDRPFGTQCQVGSLGCGSLKRSNPSSIRPSLPHSRRSLPGPLKRTGWRFRPSSGSNGSRARSKVMNCLHSQQPFRHSC